MVCQIAAILTVHNRRQKTLDSLTHLFAALDCYNSRPSDEVGAVELSVWLTDDGCTDGTPQAVTQQFAQRSIHLVEGDGTLFWTGGMRRAWQAAIDSGSHYDYFLLMNDDTNATPDAFTALLQADRYTLTTFGLHGLCSGITSEPGQPQHITYGGFNFVNKTRGRQVLVMPTGTPQAIDLVHANILLVHHTVVDTMGIFYHGYTHSCADHDYSMQAHRHHLPVMVTGSVCGECPYDHSSNRDEILQLRQMTLAQRKQYVSQPTHSDRDYLAYVRRNLPLRYPMAWLLRTVRLYLPSLYYHLTSWRGVYKES